MYEYTGTIRYSELDSKGVLSLPALLDYFQDCSTFHSETIGLGMDYMKKIKKIWAMSSWQIVIKRYPKLFEEVSVGTLPYEFKGFIGYRNFQMRTREGEQLAVANSIWSLIDMETGRPSMATPEMLEGFKIEPKLEMDYADRKVKFTGEGEERKPLTIMPHHLDTNVHVNNGQFVRIAMDYLPEDFTIGQMRAEYRMQAHLGDVMIPVVYTEADKVGISLQDQTHSIFANVEFTSHRMEKEC